MLRTVVLMALAVQAVSPAAARDWSLSSPDGRTTIAVSLGADGRLTYRVTHNGARVVDESPLGVRRDDQAFTGGLRFLSASPLSRIDDRYTMPHGKRREHRAIGRQQTLTFANANGALLDLILHAQDDGVAFRYRFPSASSVSGADNPKTVLEEQ